MPFPFCRMEWQLQSHLLGHAHKQSQARVCTSGSGSDEGRAICLPTMQGQGVLVRAARLGISAVARLCQPAPSVTGIRHMVLYDERERGEEV